MTAPEELPSRLAAGKPPADDGDRGVLRCDIHNNLPAADQDGCAVPEEAVDRVKHLLAINKSLRHRFNGDAEAVRAWLRRPCAALRNQSPLQVMLGSVSALPRLRDRLGQESGLARECCKKPGQPEE